MFNIGISIILVSNYLRKPFNLTDHLMFVNVASKLGKTQVKDTDQSVRKKQDHSSTRRSQDHKKAEGPKIT